MMQYCSEQQSRGNIATWPNVIQFEMLGHSDKIEGEGTEMQVTGELEEAGYKLVCYSHYNTHLVYQAAIEKNVLLRKWTSRLQCSTCGIQKLYPYVFDGEYTYCKVCMHC